MLGIHYAQFPEEWELKQKDGKDPITQAALQADSHYIHGLSGMTCVVPAVDIRNLLYSPELTRMRDAINGHLLATRGKPSGGIKNEVVAPPSSGDNPNHREDFNRLLAAAARKRVQED